MDSSIAGKTATIVNDSAETKKRFFILDVLQYLEELKEKEGEPIFYASAAIISSSVEADYDSAEKVFRKLYNDTMYDLTEDDRHHFSGGG